MNHIRLVLLLLAMGLGITGSARAQGDTAVKALIVIAHPDDETGFAATVYKITHELGGKVDLALVTNGEGGFKYSTLAEPYYGLELTDEKVGREHLPTIRKRELMAAGRIIGIRHFFFLDQLDHRYTQNVDSVLKHVWDVNFIKGRLAEIITKGEYDYIFCLLPTPDTHGAHKGATILALETVAAMTSSRRPVVLAGTVSAKKDTAVPRFTGLPGYPITSIRSGAPRFFFDRTQKFGYRDALDYRIIVNWEIAEHKSQGTMQMLMNVGEIENFWSFDFNDPAAVAAAAKLYDRLKVLTFEKKEYR